MTNRKPIDILREIGQKAAREGRTITAVEYNSVDGFPVLRGGKFWDNNLRVVEIQEIAAYSNPYADTGETQTWHHTTTAGDYDTISGSMQPYGRLVRRYEGKDAASYPVGTNYSDVKGKHRK